MKVKIVGGMSGPYRISIMSVKYAATAVVDRNGKITCDVKPRRISSLLARLDRWPIPRLVRLCLLLLDGMPPKGMLVCAAGIVIGLACGYISRIMHPTPQPRLMSDWQIAEFWILTVGALVYFIYILRRYIASYHAAEHMAIAAYERTGTTEVENISRESRINDRCGGRLILPLIMADFAAMSIASQLKIDQVIVSLIGMECVLWIDKLVDWGKLPITRQTNHLLQRYLTTRQPGDLEISTAQFALQCLIERHESDQSGKLRTP
ncbi:MAG: DUF1385 domain-containing protein [Patescibacteria group bacterium]|nr:DUF1385 domain-containing protein [Patescibacteria group bacterium]